MGSSWYVDTFSSASKETPVQRLGWLSSNITKKGGFNVNAALKSNKDNPIDLTKDDDVDPIDTTEDDDVYPSDINVPKLRTYDSIMRECAELRAKVIDDINEGGHFAATMCTRIFGTVDGTVIAFAELPAGQLRDQQVDIESNIDTFNAKAFGDVISKDTGVLRRTGTDHPDNKNRYLTTRGTTSFGNAGPYARELEQVVKFELKPAWERLPGVLSVYISGAHIFLDVLGMFNEHTDGSAADKRLHISPAKQNEYVILYHQGRPVWWGQRPFKYSSPEDRKWTMRKHGYVLVMNPGARQLAHMVAGVEGTYGSFLVKLITDGLDDERTIAIVQNSLTVAGCISTVGFILFFATCSFTHKYVFDR